MVTASRASSLITTSSRSLRISLPRLSTCRPSPSRGTNRSRTFLRKAMELGLNLLWLLENLTMKT